MVDVELKNIVEAILLSSTQPVSLKQMRGAFDEGQRPSVDLVKIILDQLKNEYKERSFELTEVASGFRIQTRSKYSIWVSRMQIEKPAKYSRPLLETLAIIAYKQPVTRGDIEEIRGVAVNSQIIKMLIEREWIRIAGHRDVPGKPAVYTTTKEFLNYFNLQYLNELPTLTQPKVKEEGLEPLNVHNAKQPIKECVTE